MSDALITFECLAPILLLLAVVAIVAHYAEGGICP